MPQTAHWLEVDSEVHPAGNWILLVLGTISLLLGGIGLFVSWYADRRGMPFWLSSIITGFVALIGACVFVKSLGAAFCRRRVRHAAPDVLPDVPNEPVTRDRSFVAVRLMHELIEDSAGWQLRPSERLRRNDKRILLGFGIPFLTVIAGLLSWAVHSQQFEAGWPGAILAGCGITLLCGGSVIIATVSVNRSQIRSLCRLTIPYGEGDLELEIPQQRDTQKKERGAGLQSANAGNETKDRLTIPRQQLLAVQLCPWKSVSAIFNERNTTWAVQGLLVVTSTEATPYLRLPILLTGDMPGAARLMQQLAAVLHVPYLFGADAAGCALEQQRARNRPPQTNGRIST